MKELTVHIFVMSGIVSLTYLMEMELILHFVEQIKGEKLSGSFLCVGG